MSQADKSVDWHAEETQDKFAILDKAGRIQLPREMLDEMKLSDNKIRLVADGKKIILENPEEE